MAPEEDSDISAPSCGRSNDYGPNDAHPNGLGRLEFWRDSESDDGGLVPGDIVLAPEGELGGPRVAFVEAGEAGFLETCTSGGEVSRGGEEGEERSADGGQPRGRRGRELARCLRTE